MVERVKELAPLSEEEQKTDRKIRSFIEDFSSRFINTEGIQPASGNEKVSINISRVEIGDQYNTIIENINITEIPTKDNKNIIELYFFVPGSGYVSAESSYIPGTSETGNNPHHIRPRIIFSDDKTGQRLFGMEALDAAHRLIQGGKVKSLPSK